ASLENRGERRLLQPVDCIGLVIEQGSAYQLSLGKGRVAVLAAALRLLELVAPAKTNQAGALRHRLWTAEPYAHIVPPAQGRHGADELLFVTTPGVEHHQQGISIVRLVLPRNKPCFHQRAGRRCRRIQRCAKPVEAHLWKSSRSSGIAA